MSSDIPVAPVAAPSLLPQRPLGQTGTAVTLFGLGGEGILRTYDRAAEAVRVIHRALEHGVNYCDTAPAYAGSLDYYRNHRKTPSFSYGDIRWCLRSRQSISSEVRGVTMKPLALAMGRSHPFTTKSECAVKAQWRNVARPERMQVLSEPLELSSPEHSGG